MPAFRTLPFAIDEDWIALTSERLRNASAAFGVEPNEPSITETAAVLTETVVETVTPAQVSEPAEVEPAAAVISNVMPNLNAIATGVGKTFGGVPVELIYMFGAILALTIVRR